MKKVLLFVIPISFLISCSSGKVECVKKSNCKYKKTFKKGEGYDRDKWGYCRQTYSGMFCSIKCAGCSKEAGK